MGGTDASDTPGLPGVGQGLAWAGGLTARAPRAAGRARVCSSTPSPTASVLRRGSRQGLGVTAGGTPTVARLATHDPGGRRAHTPARAHDSPRASAAGAHRAGPSRGRPSTGRRTRGLDRLGRRAGGLTRVVQDLSPAAFRAAICAEPRPQPADICGSKHPSSPRWLSSRRAAHLCGLVGVPSGRRAPGRAPRRDLLPDAAALANSLA